MMQVEYPVYWTYNEFTDGFRKLLDHLQLDKVRGGGGGGGVNILLIVQSCLWKYH